MRLSRTARLVEGDGCSLEVEGCRGTMAASTVRVASEQNKRVIMLFEMREL
jgi:hypothetical protein